MPWTNQIDTDNSACSVASCSFVHLFNVCFTYQRLESPKYLIQRFFFLLIAVF